MRKPSLLALALVLAVSAETGMADAKGKKKKPAPKPKTGAVMTGDPLPAKPKSDPACPDQGALRIMGSGPTNPFALVKKGKIAPAGQACCAQWSRKGSHWKTVDAWGAIVGEAEVTGGEGYDVTQCWELSMAKKKGSLGVGLYLDGDYQPPASVAWTPNDAEKNALAKVVASLEVAMVPNAVWDCGKTNPPAEPFAKRSLFFTVPSDNGNGASTRWAVVGGPLLVLARVQADGKWVVRHVDAFGADGCQHKAYVPRAVFDVDGDGDPEVFVHYDFGDGFGDVVLGRSHQGFEGKWELLAESVGGSTA